MLKDSLMRLQHVKERNSSNQLGEGASGSHYREHPLLASPYSDANITLSRRA
jgi:hypothetical protein